MIRWLDEAHCEVDGTPFLVWDTTNADPMNEAAGDDTQLVLLKPRALVEEYTALRDRFAAGNVVELGIYRGGSTAFLDLLLHPRKLVALDRQSAPAVALTHFLAGSESARPIRAFYGVDQSDTARLVEIIDEEFGGEPLDLVVDDASHLLPETTSSFNILFPRLRPGGVFAIEDWSSAHIYERTIRSREDLRGEAPIEALREAVATPLSLLVLQVVLATAYARDIVARVDVHPDLIIVERGPADLDPTDFDITSWQGVIGEELLARSITSRPSAR